MSRPIEQTLSNLIPRWSEDLPIELIDLARSLLAQSRTKCTLKPEEEIARTYACANLACERYCLFNTISFIPNFRLLIGIPLQSENNAQPPPNRAAPPNTTQKLQETLHLLRTRAHICLRLPSF